MDELMFWSMSEKQAATLNQLAGRSPLFLQKNGNVRRLELDPMPAFEQPVVNETPRDQVQRIMRNFLAIPQLREVRED